MSLLHLALALFVSTALGCQEPSGGSEANCDARPVRMGVASSLREVAERVREELDRHEPPVETEMVFGSSSALARQIRLGAPLDLLVSADAEIVDALLQERRLAPGTETEIARGRLSLVVRADPRLGARVSETFESTQSDAAHEVLESADPERIAIPSPAVPLGRYARAWLEAHGLLDDLAGRIVLTEHARATLSAVDAGLVDMAIVYASDARLATHAVVAAEIDPSEHPPIRYVAARVAEAPSCASIDEALFAWATPRTVERFAELGFAPARAPGTPDGDPSRATP